MFWWYLFSEDTVELVEGKVLELHEIFANTQLEANLINVKKNQEKVFWFHNLSAELLTKVMNYNFGLDYFNGSEQTNKNVIIGLIRINEAIKQGYSAAKRFISEKYYYGYDSLKKDQEKALKLYKALVDRNDAYGSFK
ncbi:hypothetical protein K501DRAFT_274152 [Backusella circina FSU 941]|nr:hypothetical protein K501DRAFT_274152 [Backusella circina FSU 941]